MNDEQINDPTSPTGIEYTYKLIKGADGYLYVSVQPLMKDIQISAEKMVEMDTSNLSPENKEIFELKLLGLKTVYEFLGALVTEQLLKDKAHELKGNVPLNTESNYYPAGVPSNVKH